MRESEFHQICDDLFAQVESILDDAEVDFDSAGGVVDIRPDDAPPVIVNRQPAMREIWIAAKSGGFHFRQDPQGLWRDTRDNAEFFSKLRALLGLRE